MHRLDAVRQAAALNPVVRVERHPIHGAYACLADFLDALDAGRYPPPG